MRMRGRKVLITGGASGIGLATARRFIAEGARVALLDRESSFMTGSALGLDGGSVFH